MSRVIDALLSDPEWSPRIARDSRGARVGAVGHSAGGYTVIALAGGMPELSRLAAHCNIKVPATPPYVGWLSRGNHPHQASNSRR